MRTKSAKSSASRRRRGSIAWRSGAIRRAPPPVAPAAAVCPTAQSRETSSRESGRGRGPHRRKARIASTGFRCSRGVAGRSPARRRGLRDRRWPRCGPRSPAPACWRTPGATAAPVHRGLSRPASRLAMTCSAATSRQCLRIAAWYDADVGEMPVEAAARHPHRLGQRLGLQCREAAFGQCLEALIEPVFGGELIGHEATCDNPPYTTVLTGASAAAIYHTVVYGGSECAISCCNVRASPRSWRR